MVYIEWIDQPFAITGDQNAWGIATDSNNNIYISGITFGSSLDGTPNAGNQDAWLGKYDTQGNLLWTKQLGTSDYDFSFGVATDSNDNIYITGWTLGSLDGTPSAGYADAWVAKYDTQGNLLWTEELGTSTSDTSWDVTTDINGNVYITGETRGSLDVTPNAGLEDAWVAKYDTQGNLLWTEQLGTSEEDSSLGVSNSKLEM